MLILLPPSEKKKSATSSEKFELSSLTFSAELSGIRSQTTAGYDHSQTSPAIEIYDGVLYQGLGWHSLSATQRKRANSRVLIVSALFGLVKPLDQIFQYKAKIDSKIWRDAIATISAKFASELVIDCRSSTYKNVWAVNPENTVEVRVFKVAGSERTVITHMSKKYRGELTRHLLTQASDPVTPADVQRIAAQLFECELHPPTDGQPWVLNLLIS
ncbi:MAG: peroxide stress protein YaaA [Actinobacteria bacterium]|nr:peroxide stress protein YaaA [Actinomycetota bacterium]